MINLSSFLKNFDFCCSLYVIDYIGLFVIFMLGFVLLNQKPMEIIMKVLKKDKKIVKNPLSAGKAAKFQNRIQSLDIEKLKAHLSFGPLIYGHIYEIHFFKAGKTYRGQTSEPVGERWKRHISEARGTRSTTLLSKAIRKFGSGDDAVKIRILAKAYSFEELDGLELKFIEKSKRAGIECLNSHKKGYKKTKNRVPFFISSAPGFKSMRDIWRGVIRRCYDPSCKQFHRYGGRGIGVCFAWRQNFSDFLLDMWPSYEEGLSLDRIDNDGNYTPKNCRWATQQEQVENSTSAKPICIDGNSYPSIVKACGAHGNSYGLIKGRRKRKGMSLVDAIKTPRSPEAKEVLINGVLFESELLAREHHGVSRKLVRERLKLGWDIDRAYSTKKLKYSQWKSNNQPLMVYGIQYPSIQACADFYGIDHSTLGWRINVKGMSLEEAVSQPNANFISLVIDGIKFNSIKEALSYFSILPYKYKRLLSKGMDRVAAIKLAAGKINTPKK